WRAKYNQAASGSQPSVFSIAWCSQQSILERARKCPMRDSLLTGVWQELDGLRRERNSTPFTNSEEGDMETQELHRGRLIDHLQLVVRDLDAAQKFYTAIFEVLGVPLGGVGEDYFWVDELFISTADSAAAQGVLTGRHHLAFQAQSRVMVDQAYQAALAQG